MGLQTFEPPAVRWQAPEQPAPPVSPAPPSRRRPPRRARAVRPYAAVLGAGVALAFLLTLPFLIALALAVRTADARLDAIPPLADGLADPPERSVVLDREGRRLATLQVENRKSVDLDRVPDHVVDAVLATEDQTFWEHDGVNWSAVMRAAARNASSGEISGGGSTVTQQLVKNRVVGDERSLKRKLTEAVYASQLERSRSKREILEMYLNDTYFGNGVYGIATAAEYYWRTPIRKLTLPQAALLAGMIRAPERNNPVDHPDNALARREVVLGQMVDQRMITREQADTAASAKLKLRIKDRSSNGAPFLVDVIRRELESDPRLGETPQQRWNAVLTEGLRIRTTFDLRLQRIAERTIRDLLDEPRTDPLASIVAIDASNGELLTAAVGPKRYGDGPKRTTINPAVPGLGGTGRQPGSTFKAFELVTALEHDVPVSHGFHSAASVQSTSSQCPQYSVSNYGGADLGLQQMAQATATSSNTYFLHLMDIAGGPDALVETAQRMGITSELDPYCSLVLGSEEVFPTEMATAFATLANDGLRCEPHAIRQIRDRDGEVVRRRKGRCERAVEAPVARQVTSLLRGPIENGTASRHGQIGRPAAGKTGTTTNGKDAWFVGYTPQLSVATWVGHELPEQLVHPLCGEVTGGCLPTMLWQRFTTQATAELGLAAADFPAPPPPPERPVPSVVGMSRTDAVQTLLEAGFLTAVEQVPGDEPAETVVSQTPARGQTVTEGSTVQLAVSDGLGIDEPEPDPLPLPEPDEDRGPVLPLPDDDGDGRPDWPFPYPDPRS
ncbi:MAG: transglycosylase domain-containing protein, partial [Actinobacteria bacterium]|nr:transglycosylase domain-containing protein [Actinomycetota bacterium]